MHNDILDAGGSNSCVYQVPPLCWRTTKRKTAKRLVSLTFERLSPFHTHLHCCRHILGPHIQHLNHHIAFSWLTNYFSGSLVLGKGTTMMMGRSSINKKDSTTLRVMLVPVDVESSLKGKITIKNRKKSKKKQLSELLVYSGTKSISSGWKMTALRLTIPTIIGVVVQLTLDILSFLFFYRKVRWHLRVDEIDTRRAGSCVPPESKSAVLRLWMWVSSHNSCVAEAINNLPVCFLLVTCLWTSHASLHALWPRINQCLEENVLSYLFA